MQADVNSSSGNFTFDISGLSLPLVINEGVILEGTYDPIVNPGGTHITCTTRVNYPPFIESMYMFVMKNGSLLNPTTIRKLNISGPSWHWQDFNAGPVAGFYAYVGGIFIDRPPLPLGYGQYHLIQDCELWGFSNSAIWSDVRTKDITIERCYIHHTKGYSYHGIGYGIWFISAYDDGLAHDPAENLIVKNSMFDECKSAIDGQGYEYEWLINDCSFSQFMFVDDINGHDQESKFFDHSAATGFNNCLFYDNYMDPLPAGVDISNQYTIERIGGWRTIIQHSIFHRKVLVSSVFQSTSNINIPYPNANDPNARIEITNNTFASQLYAQNTFDRNKGGFAAFSGNYSAECVWLPDFNYIISQPNKFSYERNSTVNTLNTPQPPVFDFQLQDMNGNPLAQNSNGVAVIDLNTNITGQFKVALNSGAPNQNLRYYLRTNPSEGVSNTTSNITQSIQNHFFRIKIQVC
ncbi:MAG: hypothetical protein IPP71_11560 [Bacteroidetes bacterium]|nr:hypothetical protein [Bacteroidota bacterium]